MLTLSLRTRLTLLLGAAATLAFALHAALVLWPLPPLLLSMNRWMGLNLSAPAPGSWSALMATLLLLAPTCWLLATRFLAPLGQLLRALEGAVLSYRDGDFNMTIAAPVKGRDSVEMAALLQVHHELGAALREQRQLLAQRELLLDTVVQHTPLALLLCDPLGRVAYANIAARQLLSQGRGLAGASLSELLASAPAALREALNSEQDQLFEMEEGGLEERFHLSQRSLSLQGQPYRLLLLRRMTHELSRQEVVSWKRVIRVISHELNNSLAPISSLAHSGAELARRGQVERLSRVFQSIGERAAHLHAFLSSYARFAKLPQPLLAPVAWADFLAHLSAHCEFQLQGELPQQAAHFDAAQIEQAVINLIRNAHEAGGPPEAVTLSVERGPQDVRLIVADRGPGMSEAVLAQALLPFYSTKRSGTGLGLALAREIAEAHGGRIVLANREGGGLQVSLVLPLRV